MYFKIKQETQPQAMIYRMLTTTTTTYSLLLSSPIMCENGRHATGNSYYGRSPFKNDPNAEQIFKVTDLNRSSNLRSQMYFGGISSYFLKIHNFCCSNEWSFKLSEGDGKSMLARKK